MFFQPPNHFHFLIRTRTKDEQKAFKIGSFLKNEPIAELEPILEKPIKLRPSPVSPFRLRKAGVTYLQYRPGHSRIRNGSYRILP